MCDIAGLAAISADFVSLDYLTLTLDTTRALNLLRLTDEEEHGGPRPGFARSELRTFGAASQVWRRMDPHQPSKLWDRDYESWEASGPAAGNLGAAAAWDDARPSRIDVAFDCRVAPGVTPEHIVELTREHFERLGLTDGISGQAGVNTCYIGSAKSERRIRIYRKDLQPKSRVIAVEVGPLLRVELVLRGAAARAIWPMWCNAENDAYSAAAAHIQDMIGLCLADPSEVPEREAAPVSSVVERVAYNIAQNHNDFLMLQDMGVDLRRLCEVAQSMRSRTTKWRHERKAEELRSMSASEIEDIIEKLLKHGKSGENDIDEKDLPF